MVLVSACSACSLRWRSAWVCSCCHNSAKPRLQLPSLLLAPDDYPS